MPRIRTINPAYRPSAPRPPIPPHVRAAVVARDGMRCRYCGCTVVERRHPRYAERNCVELDHVLPVSRGGLSTFDNLVVACLGCNRAKRDREAPAHV